MPGIIIDAIAGVAIEKAIEIISSKFQKSELEKAANVIKKVIGEYFKPDGNDYHNALKTWNTDEIQSRTDLLFCLYDEGIYNNLKKYQDSKCFTRISEDEQSELQSFKIPDENLNELASTLFKLIREKSKSDKHLRTVTEQFDEEFEKEYQRAFNAHTQEIVKQINEKLKIISIQDANVAYYHEFRSPLFLEEKRKCRITLENMYCSPVVNANSKESFSASEMVNNWFLNDDDHSVLLLFGDAGVGKSSLCRKMVRDAMDSNADNREFKVSWEKLHVIPLRDKIEELETWADTGSIKSLLKKLFSIKDWPIDNELFVLDGLDEVEVLSSKFPLASFLSKLHSFTECGLKIMITSRKTDLIEKEANKFYKDNHMECRTLSWTVDTVPKWCTRYKNYRQDLTFDKWIEDFLNIYKELQEKKSSEGDSLDERCDILRIPVILYIVCYSRIKIKNDSTIGSIYDKAFRTLLKRKHISNDTAHEVLFTAEGDKQSDGSLPENETLARQVQWQFTKELAFQMFLYGTLTLSDLKQPNAIANAKSRTIAILKHKGVQITDDYQIDTKAYFAVFLFARENSDETGIVFAHKTVYEYFAAVKLYEDYLSMPDIEHQSHEMVWEKLISAFRYKMITDDILRHLKVLHQKDAPNNFGILGKRFSYGIAYQLIVPLLISLKPVPEYVIPRREMKNGTYCPTLLSKQISFLLSNLTHYLCERGYTNNALSGKDLIYFKYSMQILFDANAALQVTNSYFDDSKDLDWNVYRYDLRKWEMPFFVIRGSNLRSANLAGANLADANLKHARLGGAHLEGADLAGADLRNAYLQEIKLEGLYLNGANLERANLEGARLAGAILAGARLAEACLAGANLAGANLAGANLAGTNLQGANLQGAFYSEKTTFPEDFDPHKHGMRCVD